MSKYLNAHTNRDPSYPGFINFSREDDGSVSVIVRGDPSTHEGCSHVKEGASAKLTLSAADFDALIAGLVPSP